MALPLPRRFAFALLTAAAFLPLGCSLASSDAPPAAAADDNAPGFYRDATAESGAAFTYRNGEDAGRYAILESLGGGVAVFDYDGDGKYDLFFPGGGYFDGPDKKQIKGYPPKLFRNLGNFKFEDATAAAGLNTLADNQPWFYSHGAAVA